MTILMNIVLKLIILLDKPTEAVASFILLKLKNNRKNNSSNNTPIKSLSSGEKDFDFIVFSPISKIS